MTNTRQVKRTPPHPSAALSEDSRSTHSIECTKWQWYLVPPSLCESSTKVSKFDGTTATVALKGGRIYEGQSRTQSQKLWKQHLPLL